MRLRPAELLLQDLGVTEPKEIDLEAIAFYVNAHVRYRFLDGCEAQIVGSADKAIITVNRNSSQPRRRFSIAHELGHWHHHRGRCLTCRADEYRPRSKSPERTADRYAADLLMPRYLFDPMINQCKGLDFAVIRSLAETFDVSRTAMAIRAVESDYSSAMLVCHGEGGRKWFTRAPSVPERWFPQEYLESESFAHDVQFGSGPDGERLRKMEADAWFDRPDANRFEILEQTITVGPNETLTLLVFTDEEMLSE